MLSALASRTGIRSHATRRIFSGIAGPDGGTKEKPVGLVFLALAQTGEEAVIKRYVFAGTRTDIRRATVAAALELLLSRLQEE